SVAATMIAHRPQGWGLDTMAFTSPGYIGKEIYAYESLTTVVDRAHNELLQMLLSVGFVGCALWLVLVASVLYGSWQHGQQDRSGMLKAAGRGIAAYAVTLLFGFPSLVTLVFFWVLIGICIGRLEGKDVSTPQWVERSVQCVFTAIAVIALVVSVQWMHARWLYAQARVTEGLRTFQYDRQNLIDAAQVHLFALEQNPGDASIAESTEAIIEILNHLTAGQDGMVHILRAWLAATQGDSERTYASLNAAHTFYYQSIMEHRAALHILSLIGDTVGAYEHESAIRSFLPNAFFDESSQLHRILLKQHPWLEHITDAPPRGE
ncbi:MAG: O-antigen ligase family protein, partial [Candidatus Peregrinibacteria bacterium]|nr:O-antigen ligase family protein [Candidatus Peregrinibacteria bacterium]